MAGEMTPAHSCGVKPLHPSHGTSGSRCLTLLFAVCAALVNFLALPGVAQVADSPAQSPSPEPMQGPPLAAAVTRLLGAEYLSDDERRSLRLRHGVWTDEDLASPALRARAALVRGAWDDTAFNDPDCHPLDRAEALLRRGDLHDALTSLDGLDSIRAIRLRAEALEALGRLEEADAALEPLVARLVGRRVADADELVEGVRGLAIRLRLHGSARAADAAGGYRSLMSMLAVARDEMDRLSWTAHLAEAELLYSRDNLPEAGKAVEETLRLNPSCAAAWSLAGRMAVDSFDFDRAESIAQRLHSLAGPGLSADGAAISARARLRQSDPEGASLALAPALERFPRDRTLLALEAAATAARFDDAGLERALAAFDALNGTERSAEALYEVGRALSEARQYQQAADALERAAARRPTLPEPWIELGLLELQAGRDLRARDALRRAASLDPFNLRAENSLRLIEELLTYETLESDHFIVRFRPGPDAMLAREMLPVLEHIHSVVAGPEGFNHEPSQRTQIELMPDHSWFSVRITGMPRVHTMAASTGPVIAMEAPREGPRSTIGPYDWPRTLQHEYAHTVTLSRTNNRIPHWFTEAAAVWVEHAPVDPRWWSLLVRAYERNELFDLDTISLRFVRPLRPTDRSQAYAQGWWMYRFMVERWGNEAPLALMDRYAAGDRQSAAMRAVLGITPEQFFEAFLPWARAELERLGLALPEGTPTLRDLLMTEVARRLERDALWAERSGGGEARAGEPPGLPDFRRTTLPPPDAAMTARWLERHPGHPDALAAAVQIALASSRGRPTPDMAPLLERLAAARPEDPLPRRHLAKLAIDGSLPGAPERAIEHLEYLDARELRSPAYALELAERYAKADRLDEAWEKAVRASRIAPFDATVREQAARIALLRDDLAAARTQIEALIVLEPDREIHRRRLEALRARQ